MKRMLPWTLPLVLAVGCALLGASTGNGVAWAHAPEQHQFRLVEFKRPLPAPDFSAENARGGETSLADFRGRYVLLNFWATWCVPCVKEMPDFEKLAEKLSGEDFALLTVNFGEKTDRIRPFLKKIEVDVPVLLDPDMGTSKAWVKAGLPTTYIIDANQNIRYQVLGALEWASPEVEDKIRELLPK